MYSPKIAEDLIPLLYREAQRRDVKMTELVDKILRETLQEIDERAQKLPYPE